ncbi:DUF2177 family protein [Patescibacteria group bacterium]
MMKVAVSFVSSLVCMLTIDAIWLKIMSKAFYTRHIGQLMAATPRLLPAGIFYLIYTFALTFLVVIPALQNNFSLTKTFALGALFGLAAYATYDLTNQATIKNWPTIVTVVDLIWGALLTGVVATAAFLITKHFS